jgi:acyl-CoA thioesterase
MSASLDETTGLFDDDTRVERIDDGRLRAAISDRWNALGGSPNGGYLLAVCLQALRHELTLPDPLVASAHFLRPAIPGQADVHTDVARSGRRVATGEARLVQEGKERVRVVASFTDANAVVGRALELGTPPALPAPDKAIDPLAELALPGITIADRIEYRMDPAARGWHTGEPSGDPTHEFWMRFRDGHEADAWSLPLFVDAFSPAVLELGLGSFTVELTVHVRARPVAGWLACRVATQHLSGGFHEEDFEIWDEGGRLVAQSRQLGLLISDEEPS